MKFSSILLPLDGSAESRQALQVATAIAKSGHAKLVAQSVLDTGALMQLIGHDRAGIIGSGPYMAAYETCSQAFRSVCETVLFAFESIVDQSVDSATVLDEGGLVAEILKRAQNHDLVVVGHRFVPHMQDERERYFERYSLSERLANYCGSPLLIVGQQYSKWKTARLLVSPKSFSKSMLEQYRAIADAMQLEREIFIVESDENLIKQFAQNLHEWLASDSDARIVHADVEERDSSWDCGKDVRADTLLVISTMSTDAGRRTCGGTNIGSFLAEHRSAPVVILPSEKISLETATATSRQTNV